MAGWTNRGKYLMFDSWFRAAAAPTTFYVALVTSAAAPGPDTNVMSDLTQIATGNGYADGGKTIARDATDWDVLTEDDGADVGFIQAINQTWTASGGPIPASGNGARYAVLTDDNATVANRQVLAYWDLTADRSVQDGSPFTLIDLELRGTE